MSLQEQIKESIKEAMRSKEAERLEVLRGIKTAFTNELVATKRTPQDELSDEEALSVITRLAKQRKESIAQFTQGGRPDLAQKEALELSILDEYLPEMMSKDKIRSIASAKAEELGITDKTKQGMLMGALMKELRGKADGNDVKEVVESLLG